MRSLAVLVLFAVCLATVPVFGAFPSDTLAVLASAARENLARLERDHAAAAQALAATGLTGEGASDALLALCARPGAVDCASVSPEGVMVLVEPAEFKAHEGAFIGGQHQVQRALHARRPAASGLFVSVEGVRALDFEHPVLRGGEIVGLASILVEPAGFFGAILCGATIASGGTAAVAQPDGRILWASKPDLVGAALADTRLVPGGTENAARVLSESEGSLGNGLVWTTISLYDVNWRLLFRAR